MTDRLSPQRAAEIATAVAELDADRTLSFGTWTASPVTEKSTLPPEQAFAVEDVARIGGATLRGSVGVFGDERHAAFTALARTAVSELLAELAAVRAERDCLALAVLFARQWSGGTPFELHKGIDEILATMPSDGAGETK